MGSSDARRRRATTLALGAAALVLLAFVWQASPLFLWHLRFERELTRLEDDPRLYTPTRQPAATPSDWSGLRIENLSLRIPLDVDDHALCAACTVGCVLPLALGGTVAIFDAPPPESLAEALDQFAPNADDLSVFRSVARNWLTIDALTDRARAPGRRPAAFRFISPGSRGTVTGFEVNGSRRYVVYAYAHAGDPARVLGVTGVSALDFDRILSSVRVSTADAHTAARPGECG